MLIKVLCSAAQSQQDYRQTLIARRRLSTIGVLAGLITLVVVLIFYPEGESHFAGFLKGVYSGTGVGLILLGSMDIAKKNKLLANPELMKKKAIEDRDERQREITMRASSTTLLILMGLGYGAVLISGIFSSAVFFTMLVSLFVLLAVLVCTLTYYGKRM